MLLEGPDVSETIQLWETIIIGVQDRKVITGSLQITTET